MNHTTQSVIIVSMLAALTVAGISIVTSKKARALTTRALDGESMITGRDGISVTDGDATLDTGDTEQKATPTDTGNRGDTEVVPICLHHPPN